MEGSKMNKRKAIWSMTLLLLLLGLVHSRAAPGQEEKTAGKDVAQCANTVPILIMDGDIRNGMDEVRVDLKSFNMVSCLPYF
jgi:hypothetical protein